MHYTRAGVNPGYEARRIERALSIAELQEAIATRALDTAHRRQRRQPSPRRRPGLPRKLEIPASAPHPPPTSSLRTPPDRPACRHATAPRAHAPVRGRPIADTLQHHARRLIALARRDYTAAESLFREALDRRRSKFFYDDTILPAALASVSGSTGGDFHRFDFERTRTTADLELDVTPATRLSFGVERQTRAGASTTTLTVERDEFDVDRPLDESLDGFTFGVRHAWRRATLIVTEEANDFRNTSELVLPGASPGRNLTDAAALSFFTRDQSYDYASRGHGIRVLANPTARVDLTAAWRREDLELDGRASEQALGTTFGGNGQTTFALPDYRGRTPIHVGAGHTLGERGGEQAHTLSIAELPTHTHVLHATSINATSTIPSASEVLATAGLDLYRDPTNLVAMEPGIVGNTGGSQPHENMQPYLTLSFCIALQGIFPSPN